MGKISVVINTLNEEKNLPRALSSIKKLADEIVVVDAMSTDKTVKVASGHGAKVHVYKETVTYVEPVRNFAISKAIYDWVLILDADEELPRQLTDRLKEISNDENSADYFRIPRKNVIFGKWIKHSRWWPDYNIRFFKKGYVTWSEVIHSVPMTKGEGADLEAGEENAIIHHHYEDLEQYIERLNRYTTEHAKLMRKEGYEFHWKDLIIKPINEFLSRYFQGEGYKDGLHGLALSLLQAFSEVVMYLKVWQIEGFNEKNIKIEKVISQMKEAESDLHYWQADALLNKNGGLKNRIKRKLKLS
jgi:(heptosyl)LPS beta-1,4-glucosyltransferase